MKISPRAVPWMVVGAAAVYLALVMYPRGDAGAGFRYREFGQLPVQNGGRVMPMHSVARSALASLSGGYTTYAVKDSAGRTQSYMPATQWLVEVLSLGVGDRRALHHKVFRIDNDEVLHILGLESRVGFRYSVDEIRPRIKELLLQADQAKQKPAKERDLLDNKVLETAQKLSTFINLAEHKGPFTIPPLSPTGEWLPMSEVDYEVNPLGKKFMAMLEAYKVDDAAAFNDNLADFRGQIDAAVAEDTTRARYEDYFNAADPFWHCLILYLVAFLLAAGSWIGWSKPLSQAAYYLCIMTFIMHTVALVLRMYLLDRPFVFVTNLYSSAVFIAWGCVLIALILERFIGMMLRTSSFGGIGTAVAAIAGFLSLVVARMLSLTTEDTMGTLEAVLDTNFWLATHVTTITFGYAATFVAGFVGVLYIMFGVFSRVRDHLIFPVLGRIIYGVVCFATLLSFTGTVLGGIWADQSWGRFWGWDPKENGALIIVLWNALILHARWGGMIKHRGIAVASVMGNIVTAWSWFGVNILGVGLHSYGFSKATLIALLCFLAFNLTVIALGLMPKKYWKSYSTPLVESHSWSVPPRKEPRRDKADTHVMAE